MVLVVIINCSMVRIKKLLRQLFYVVRKKVAHYIFKISRRTCITYTLGSCRSFFATSSRLICNDEFFVFDKNRGVLTNFSSKWRKFRQPADFWRSIKASKWLNLGLHGMTLYKGDKKMTSMLWWPEFGQNSKIFVNWRKIRHCRSSG